MKVDGLFRFGMIIALSALVLDRVSKWWIMEVLELPKIQMVQILPVFTLQWVENRGVSFGLLAADGNFGRWALVVLTAGIAIGLGIWLRTVHTRLLAIAIGLVIGGAVGNIYDRSVFGYVADFLQFHVGNWSFAVFNVADSCISVGAVLLIWDTFFGSDPEDKEEMKKKDKVENNSPK